MGNEVVAKTSDMKEFEKMLDESSNSNNVVDLDSQLDVGNRLSEDKINIIDGSREFKRNVPAINQQVPAQQNMVKVQKNIILALISDSTGCGWKRCASIYNYMNFVFGKDQKLLPIVSSAFIFDPNILLRTRTIHFQRQMSDQHYQQILNYQNRKKELGLRFVYDMDDHIFWEDHERTKHGVANFNFGAKSITEEVKYSCIKIMNLMDHIMVSTQPMKDYYQKELDIKVPITVIKNHVEKYFWKDGNTKKITEKITKPKIIYTGSPTHYSNEKRLLGDWENEAWVEYVIKNVKDNKISFTCMGGLPWFLEPIKDKIKIIGWLNSYQYHLGVLGEKADFGLMPLIPNWFNYCKSNLKYIEYCAAKVVGIGCYFKEGYPYQGPYSDMEVKLDWKCSVKEIEETIEKNSYPEFYNKIIDKQSKYIEDNGHWLESSQYINEFLKVI